MSGRASSGNQPGSNGSPSGSNDSRSASGGNEAFGGEALEPPGGGSIFDQVAVSSLAGKDKDEDSDGCGSWERGHNVLVGFYTDQGVKNVPYHSISSESDPAKDCRWIEVNFHGPFTVEGEKCEGLFMVRIEGSRLGKLMRRLRKGMQTEVWVSGPVENREKPEVTAIRFSEVED